MIIMCKNWDETTACHKDDLPCVCVNCVVIDAIKGILKKYNCGDRGIWSALDWMECECESDDDY